MSRYNMAPRENDRNYKYLGPEKCHASPLPQSKNRFFRVPPEEPTTDFHPFFRLAVSSKDEYGGEYWRKIHLRLWNVRVMDMIYRVLTYPG